MIDGVSWWLLTMIEPKQSSMTTMYRPLLPKAHGARVLGTEWHSTYQLWLDIFDRVRPLYWLAIWPYVTSFFVSYMTHDTCISCLQPILGSCESNCCSIGVLKDSLASIPQTVNQWSMGAGLSLEPSYATKSQHRSHPFVQLDPEFTIASRAPGRPLSSTRDPPWLPGLAHLRPPPPMVVASVGTGEGSARNASCPRRSCAMEVTGLGQWLPAAAYGDAAGESYPGDGG